MGAIGVFDSGYGGLTVLKSLTHKLPDYNFVYFGDNLRAPYGNRSFEEVYDFTLEAVIKLFEKGCPLVILACNTASAKALRTIQQNYLPKYAPDKRVLGVIRPSTEVLGGLSNTHHVGLLATEGTVKSESYRIELEKFSPETKLFQFPCPTWVPLIENGLIHSESARKQIQSDVYELLKMSNKIDTIFLACTHYPIVEHYLKSFLPKTIHVISQGEIVAKSLLNYLERHPEIDQQLVQKGKIQYYTSGSPKLFDFQAEKIIKVKTKSKLLE